MKTEFNIRHIFRNIISLLHIEVVRKQQKVLCSYKMYNQALFWRFCNKCKAQHGKHSQKCSKFEKRETIHIHNTQTTIRIIQVLRTSIHHTICQQCLLISHPNWLFLSPLFCLYLFHLFTPSISCIFMRNSITGSNQCGVYFYSFFLCRFFSYFQVTVCSCNARAATLHL